jgi:hypothetical protein
MKTSNSTLVLYFDRFKNIVLINGRLGAGAALIILPHDGLFRKFEEKRVVKRILCLRLQL